MRFIVLATVVAFLLPAPAAAVMNPQIPGLQIALRSRGLYLGPIDGIAGPLTVRAVKRLQRSTGLAVDGIAGLRTRRELGRLGRPLYGSRTLRLRMVGWDVSVLQFLLNQRGCRTSVIDGSFGRETYRAVRRCQRRARIAEDGIAGRATMRALRVGAPHRASRAPLRDTSPASIRIALAYWANRYGIDRSLVRALAWMESGNQANVRSPAGAWGVMQVTPATWRYVESVLLRDRVPRTANGNVRVGITYLHQLLHTFSGRLRRALGAYYQGPASVQAHGLLGETRMFVRNVLALRERM
jgi:peptidoglycan hydrolase-like protein with peptidoglycan-binding domain